MALTILPLNFQSSAYFAGVSLPYMVGFAIDDDGDGGDIFLNGQGFEDPTVSDAVDLKSMFTSAGLLFNSIPLLQAFRLLYGTPNDAAAEFQFQHTLHINMFTINDRAGGTSGLPVIQAHASVLGAPTNVPFLLFSRPQGEAGVAGQWRIELTYKHSITN